MFWLCTYIEYYFYSSTISTSKKYKHFQPEPKQQTHLNLFRSFIYIYM